MNKEEIDTFYVKLLDRVRRASDMIHPHHGLPDCDDSVPNIPQQRNYLVLCSALLDRVLDDLLKSQEMNQTTLGGTFPFGTNQRF